MSRVLHRRGGFTLVALLALALTTSAPFQLGQGGASLGIGGARAAGVGPALSVDASADRHAISPYIYGMNFADEGLAAELRLPVRRWGGNATTRYNWQNDTSNRASDYYFENIPGSNNPANLPNGSDVDNFVDQDRRTGTKTLLTMPLIGWTPKSAAKSCGFSIAKYGAQQSSDPWDTDCGNGVRTDGTTITGNDPTDTSVAITPAFVQSWIQHLIGRYGTATNGGVLFYDLDNEPDIWHSTHRDVHPKGVSYDELRDATYQYAAAIKAADPGAQTLGPVGWGWSSFDYSGLDQQTCGITNCWANPPDRGAHGGTPFAAWYLQQMQAYEQAHGTRILNYFDEHFYPQESGVALSSAGDAATQALRLRSTRVLWDPTYTDESWIGQTVRLVPYMRQLVATNYPNTKTAISEYNWGGLESLNGALTQADVLGIFGREGLDLATLWAPPSSTQPGAYAFRIYRDYDGQGGSYGDTWIRSASSDQSQLAIYGAQRSSDGAVTLLVINKTGGDLTSTLSLANFGAAANAQVYRYSGANLGAIVRQADQPMSGSGFSATYPANSLTLLVLPAAGTNPTATPTATATSTTLPPTATATTTSTPVPPTNTPVPATRTATATATTTRIPSATATWTPVPPTATRTSTSVPATSTVTQTATNTPVPPTNSPTRTPVPASPTSTTTRTATATATRTPVPPTSSPTRTPIPPTVTATATVVPGTLPAPWQHADIGNVRPAGSATYTNPSFTVRGAGTDIWNTADSFHFVYQPWNGDGQIVARVASQTVTNAWAKAGVMIRASLAANAAFADMLVTPGNGTSFQRRASSGASAQSTPGPRVAAPYWVKLARVGNTITGYVSANGSTWSQVSSTTIGMGSSVYVGLAVTSHNNGSLSTAVFDGVHAQ